MVGVPRCVGDSEWVGEVGGWVRWVGGWVGEPICVSTVVPDMLWTIQTYKRANVASSSVA